MTWKPPLVVILDHSDVWRRVKAESPGTLMVGRLALPEEPDFNDPSLDPAKAAQRHCDAVLPAAERMGKTYDFWQGVNEPVVQSAEATRRLAGFEAERARIMSSHGFRVVVGSFGVGNPPQLAWWKHFLPALEAAKQYSGALALHEYAWPRLDHDSPWYLLRHRKVYKGEQAHNWGGLPPHLAGTPLLITECGLDGLIAQPEPQGWISVHGRIGTLPAGAGLVRRRAAEGLVRGGRCSLLLLLGRRSALGNIQHLAGAGAGLGSGCPASLPAGAVPRAGTRQEAAYSGQAGSTRAARAG